MKKKISLIVTLILMLATLFSFSAIGVSADTNKGWKVTVKDVAVTVGESVTVDYTLTHNDVVVDTLLADDGEGNFYGVKPKIVIYEGDELFASSNVINTKDMEVGEKTLTLVVYNFENQILEGASATFKLTIAKKDNTGTIMIIVMVIAIVGLFIWSSYSNKKKQKQAQKMASEIKIGDKVKTIGGVCGYIAEIDNAENTFVLKVGEGSFVKFDKGAIYQTAPCDAKAEPVKEEKAEAKKTTKKAPAKKKAEKPAPEQAVAEEKSEETPSEEK